MLYNLAVIESMGIRDTNFLQSMVNLYIRSIPQELEDLNKAYALKDWEKISFAAHKLKQTINTLNIISLQELIVLFENANIKNNLDDTKLEDNLETINQVLAEVVTKMKTTVSN